VAPPPAVNEPLAFINFVAAFTVGSTLQGEVVSFTSHGAMVDVELPVGGVLHCYIPLTAMGHPAPTKARQVLKKGEVRPFVLSGLDPPRRVAELALSPSAPAPPSAASEPAAPRRKASGAKAAASVRESGATKTAAPVKKAAKKVAKKAAKKTTKKAGTPPAKKAAAKKAVPAAKHAGVKQPAKKVPAKKAAKASKASKKSRATTAAKATKAPAKKATKARRS
jgi:hypothetical protein